MIDTIYHYRSAIDFMKEFHSLGYSISFLSAGFDLHYLSGGLRKENVGPHHMSLVQIEDEGLIVHSWGDELLYKEKFLWLISSVTAVKKWVFRMEKSILKKIVVFLLIIALAVILYDKYKYEKVYTDIVDGDRVYYEELEVTINGIELEGFYELGSLDESSPIGIFTYHKNQTYIVNDELEIITTYKFTDIGVTSNIEDIIINSAIRKLIYQYYSNDFNELNIYFESNYISMWENKKAYEQLTNITIHPSINKYIQIENYIYNDCLTDEELSLLVEAMANKDLDIHINEDLYNLIYNNIYELLSYEKVIEGGTLQSATGSLNIIENNDGEKIIPLIYTAYVVSDSNKQVDVRNELTDKFEQKCNEKLGDVHQIYCSFRYLEAFE